MTIKSLIIFLLPALALSSSLLKAEPISKKFTKPPTIAAFFTRPSNDPYYSLVTTFANTVSEKLNIKLETYFVDSNHLKLVNKIKQVASSKNKPDIIAFINFKKQADKILDITEKYQIPTFIFNSKKKTNLGRKSLVGTISPNDKKAGYDLAINLINKSKINKNGKIYLIGLEGDPASSASQERVQGLLTAVNEHTNVVLQQIVNIKDWSRSTTIKKTEVLLKRYPNTTAIWAASDSIALGALTSIKRKNKAYDIVIGGIDWSKEGIEATELNELAGTYGNQFMELGWVLILSYDYLSNKAIKIPNEINLPMQLIDHNNITTMKKYTTQKCWRTFDFKKLSKALNPSINKYHFKLNCQEEPNKTK